jgi:branched-chain amino acid transport system permease protein
MGSRKKILTACFLLAAVLLPVIFRNSRYTLNLLNLAGIFVILTYSLNFMHGYLGLISLGQAGFLAIGAYVTAGLTLAVGLPYLPALFLAGMASTFAGLLIGFPATRISGHYFVLISLGFSEIVRLIILNWKEVTRGTNGINNIPPPAVGPWVFDSRFSYYYLVFFFVLLTSLATLSLRRSKYGRSMLCLKVGELAATVTGVDPVKNKLINFGLSAFFAGVAGGLYAGYIGSISPEPFSINLSVDVLTMLLVGGSGTIAGPVIGATFLVFLKEGLRFMKEYYMILYGAGIVLVMILMPYGIVGLGCRVASRFRSRTG